MASKSKKKRGSRNIKNNRKNHSRQSILIGEVSKWLILALCVLILLSNFGFGGAVGAFVSKGLKTAFGWIAYLVPFILFPIGVTLIDGIFSGNRTKVKDYIKVVVSLLLVIFVDIFLQLVLSAGGAVGSFFVGIISTAVGIAGTYVVDIICMIICGVILSEKSLFEILQAGGNKAYKKARVDAAKKREAAIRRREAREKELEKQYREIRKDNKRSDRRVEGVSFATTLVEEEKPEVKEITPKKTRKAKKTPVVEEPVYGEPIYEDPVQDFVINRAQPVQTPVEEVAETPVPEEPVAEEPKRVRKTRSRLGGSEMDKEVESVAESVAKEVEKPKQEYKIPPLALLKRGSRASGDSDAHLRETAMKLQQTLETFGVSAKVTNVSCGPSVTRYEIQPDMGVKVSKIVSLADDIKLNLAAADIRIEAPIPGKAAVGIEVPNKENSAVMLRDLLESPEFTNHKSKIAFAAGKDIGGKAVVADIAKMPHVLIAGATGSGKSVCINTLIMSILYKASPDDVKLIMVDPKVVELSVYNGIPHLLIPVVTDPKKAAGALNWAVAEMTRRYQAFSDLQVRDMKSYNEKIKTVPEVEGVKLNHMPQIVIIIDELADLMMVAPGEVEEAICRLAQLARAAGIHLVLATQRPSVNVITGLIKANMPSRIAFSVSSGVDSRTIIDMNGAEKLLGKGDMLFYPSGYQKPARVQGAFVSDEEVQSVVDFLKNHNDSDSYDDTVLNQVESASSNSVAINSNTSDGQDEYFVEAGRLIIEKDKASIGMLQRAFKIGFNRAARIMDQLCEAGVVGGEEGTKPRKVLMTADEFENSLNG